ncbi:MAG: N-acetylmuramoyl-L-alanine amidase [Rhodospirillales bacterium]|nr:N-acetylmuramoyl-L-alanine amidase [Rhodospirillales bacterium]
MIAERPSPNHDARPAGGAIDMLVVHYTGMANGAAALDRLCDPAAKVSAHYLVEEDGRVFRLVPEDRRAWHAGIAFWRGVRDINARSIGVELVNPGHEFGYRPFPPAQIDAFIGLARAIHARHPIPTRNVVGHSDVAPARKTDPGELFPWRDVARAGIGLWPEERADPDAAPSIAAARDMLGRYGYETPDGDAAITTALAAFQRHFRPARVDGALDRETFARLAAAVARCG